ncbi:MAG: ferredoxin--NADP reductase [Bacteroidetes bacterium]|nr:ferredoxin--NADP reductase [Bacteroidota bacterium]MBU1115472.1 ferredoxin--NADP reductase [Bacteroidota bacterium]MBU1800083.1 ferredoxin--NADP reductase [Bacteroidota bacterium]
MAKGLELNSKVTQVIRVSPVNIIIRVSPVGWEVPEFEAGQFAVIYLPGSAPRCENSIPEHQEVDPEKMIRRAYSIASSSKNKEYIEFYITLVHDGELTPRIFALKPGDSIGLTSKFTGMFTMDKAPHDANLVLIATGTGVAPYISMLRSDALANPNRKIAVLHGAYNTWDLGYSSELSLLDSLVPNFTYIPTITDTDKEIVKWGGNVGFVQDVWKSRKLEQKWNQKLTSENTHVFLCGNPYMIDETIQLLETEGFVEHKGKVTGQIHAEKW